MINCATDNYNFKYSMAMSTRDQKVTYREKDQQILATIDILRKDLALQPKLVKTLN